MKRLCVTLVIVLLAQHCESISPLAVIKGAIGILTPFATSFIADMQARRETEKVIVKVWMHHGDQKFNGCGFYVRLEGYAGSTAETYFPENRLHSCPGGIYKMRLTSPSAMYDTSLRIGNQAAKTFEIHADGYENTHIDTMCVGFNERTISGGPKAFCLNNDLLKGCRDLRHKYQDVNINYNDILLTRTTRGPHKMIFRDLRVLVGGFEQLEKNPRDEKAMITVCDQIDLVKGTAGDDNYKCPAEKNDRVHYERPRGKAFIDILKPEDKNPYGCDRSKKKK